MDYLLFGLNGDVALNRVWFSGFFVLNAVCALRIYIHIQGICVEFTYCIQLVQCTKYDFEKQRKRFSAHGRNYTNANLSITAIS